MIPKIIHFCWFGGNDFPDDILSCMDSWKAKMPDYLLTRWDENNFDIYCNKYIEQAYKRKKWAFVSDYARLWALYNHGGIYFDCDVRVLKPLDNFLGNAFFSGYENKVLQQYIPTATIGSEKGHPFLKHLLDDYAHRVFVKPNGSLDLTTNVTRITNIAEKLYGFIGDGSYQVFGEDIHIYPYDFFSGFNGGGAWGDKTCYDITSNTHTIHEFAGSWLPEKNFSIRKRIKLRIKMELKKLLSSFTR